MRVETELMRGAGPVAVLKLLERGEMYGYELVEAISRRTEGVLDMGQSTLYPLLYNLEAKGLIKSRWEEAGAAAGADSGARGARSGAGAKPTGADAGAPEKPASRARKYYSLTGKGKARLAKDSKQWGALIGAMRALGVAPDATPRAALGLAFRARPRSGVLAFVARALPSIGGAA